MSKGTVLRALLASAAFVGASLSAGPSLAAAFTIAPVATTGQAVGPDGQTITFFGDEVSGSIIDVNDLGVVAYSASMTPVGEVPPTGVFRGMAGQAPDIIAYQGDNLGPADGVLFVVGGQVSINNAGETAFTASISTGGTFKDGLFLGDGNAAPAVTAFDGQPAGVAGDSFNSFLTPSLADNGETAFLGFLQSGDAGVFVDGGPGPSLDVALPGDPLGFPGEQLVVPVWADMNDSEQIVFNAITEISNGPLDSGIFTVDANGGPVEAVAVEGQNSFVTQEGGQATLESVLNSAPAINNNDQIAFFAEAIFNEDPVETLFFYDDGLSEVLSAGDLAGDTGETFTEFLNLATLNDNGDMAFVASTTADAMGNDVGLFLTDLSGVSQTITFEGDQLLDSLGVWQTIDSFNGLLALSIAGVAFGVDYVGGGSGIFFAEFEMGPPAEVPIPAALPLMLAGLGALRFASRRKQPQETRTGERHEGGVIE